MKTIVSLILLLLVGFIASRGLFSPPRWRLPATVLMLTGIEFFFLGVLLGPQFFGLITENVIEDLTPVAYLALGWAGLLFGIQLSLQHLRRVSSAVFRFLLVEGTIISVVSGSVLALHLWARFPDLPLHTVLSSAAVLAITAAISSPTIVAVLSGILPSRGRFTGVVKIVTGLSAVIPLFMFGIVFTVTHPGFFVTHGFLSGLLWWVFANAIGVVLGFVFTWLTRPRMHRDERLLLIIGMAMLVGGVCFFLKLSALYTAMMMGIVVGNFSQRRVQIFEQLLSIEKTLYIAFLLIIGALVRLSALDIVIMIAFYVLLRLLLKMLVSSWVLSKTFPEFRGFGVRTGLAFTAQGAMALAVALDWGLGTKGEVEGAVVAVIAGAVVVNEFIGAFLTRRSFQASGEVQERRGVTR